MKRNICTLVLAFVFAAENAYAINTDAGYYGSAKYLHSEQRATDQDISSRPGVGQFVEGKENTTLAEPHWQQATNTVTAGEPKVSTCSIRKPNLLAVLQHFQPVIII